MELTLYKEQEKKLVINLPHSGKSCGFHQLNTGERNYVEVDIDRLQNEFLRSGINFNSHSHIVSNANYFVGTETPYQWEIKFALPTDILSHRIDQESNSQLLRMIQNKKVTGFNLSPPSTMDIQFLINNMKRYPFLATSYSVVVTSGGFWVYRVTDENKMTVQRYLQKIDSLATIYRIAHDQKASIRKNKSAQHILSMNFRNSEIKNMFNIWKHAALMLRKPYSSAAIYAALNEDFEPINEEYLKKIDAAKSFEKLLGGLGVEIYFVEGSRNKDLSHQ